MAEKGWTPKREPHASPDYDQATVLAARAFFTGTANEGQQKRLFAWLMYVCGDDQLSYRPDTIGGSHATAFAEGKRFVAVMLKKLLTSEVLEALHREEEASNQERIKTEIKRRINAQNEGN